MQNLTKNNRRAIIDMGTNTFHLMIVDEADHVLFKISQAAKIGLAGINKGVITQEATDRAVAVLGGFRDKINEYHVSLDRVLAVGTSAVRNATNQAEFCAFVLAQTGISVAVISGQQEAALIYEGVKRAVQMGTEPALIIDIGGGSVEFIIANAERIFWKQSFEIGGQRLLEKYMTTDPIADSAINKMNAYFQEVLLPFHNAYHQYAPTTLIGSSGSFDTFVDVYFMNQFGHFPNNEEVAFGLPTGEFYRQYAQLITKNRSERMEMAGMIELRVDMIVVAAVLVQYILDNYDIKNIKVSSFALKEGLMSQKQPFSSFMY